MQEQPNKDRKALTARKRRKCRQKTLLLLLFSVAWIHGAASYTMILSIPDTGTIAYW
jgi:hypothetical protein